MIEYFIFGLLLLVVGGVYLWMRKRRRELTPVEDDWPGLPGTTARPTEILSRDALAGRAPTSDLQEWDDSPDAAPPPKSKAPRAAGAKPSAKRDSRRPEPPPVAAGPAEVLNRDFLQGGRARRDDPLEWPED